MPVAERPDVLTLDNFIGGRWVKASATDFFDVHNPAVGDVIGRTPLSTGGDVDAAVAAATARVSRLARHAGERARPGPLQVQAAVRTALRRARPHRHHRARQDARRGARQRPARHRVRRGGVRRAVADAGRRPRGHLGRRRLPCRPPAARRRRRDRAVQFSGDGADVVPAVRDRRRQYVHPEAVRTGAAVAAHDGGSAAAMRSAAGRREPRQRRTRCRERDLRSPRHPRGLVRRFDAGREARLPARDPRREARAGARRREEFRRRDARRRFRAVDRHHLGIVLRLRRRALPRGQHARADRRRARRGARPDGRGRPGAQGRRRHDAGRHHGAGDQRGPPRARGRLHRHEASRTAPRCSSTAARPASRIGRTATSSGRRCSTRCRRGWRSGTRRSSGRWRRSAR